MVFVIFYGEKMQIAHEISHRGGFYVVVGAGLCACPGIAIMIFPTGPTVFSSGISLEGIIW
jgi:hypothetical protein